MKKLTVLMLNFLLLLVFETVGPSVFEQSIPVTSHFGRLVTILEPGPLNWSEARMRNLLIGFELMLTPMLRDLHEARDKHVTILQQCAEWFDQARLKIHLSDQITLAEAAEAQKKNRRRTYPGKNRANDLNHSALLKDNSGPHKKRRLSRLNKRQSP